MAFGANVGNVGIGDTLTLFKSHLNDMVFYFTNSVLADIAGTTIG